MYKRVLLTFFTTHNKIMRKHGV